MYLYVEVYPITNLEKEHLYQVRLFIHPVEKYIIGHLQ